MISAFLYLGTERNTVPGRSRLLVLSSGGTFSVASKSDLLRRATMLLRLSRHASDADPRLAASFVQRAADLKEEAERLEQPDISPRAPDVER